jgi:hypothetical protein
MTGVFLDPPYGQEANREDVYRIDSKSLAADVLKWCIENGDNAKMRIALCGYAGEGHEPLEDLGWSVVEWKALGGYENQAQNGTSGNRHKERIWFSPHCLKVDRPVQAELFNLEF